MDKKIAIESVEGGYTACLNHRGSFEEFNLIYKQINKWIKNHNFKNTGSYYSRFDPKIEDLSSDDALFEIGIRVKDSIKDKNFVKVITVPKHDVISALYKGPYSNLPSIYRILADNARKNDLAPMGFPTEIYLNDPFKVKANELLTEVHYTVLEYQPESIRNVPLLNKIERKTIKKQKILTMGHHGSIEDVFKVRVDLLRWAENNNVKVDGVHFKYHINPGGISPEGMVFRVGIPIDEDVKEDSNVKVVEIPEHEVLSALYKGPYVNIPTITRMIIDYSFENNLEVIDFAEEIYLNSIFDVSCDDLLTEVRMDIIDDNYDRNIPIDKIERKTVKEHQVAFIRQKGHFEKNVKIRADLFNWIEKNNVKTSGYPYLKFFDSPNSLSPENIRYEIGIPVDRNVENIIKILDFPEHKALFLNHDGPIADLKDTHDIIKSYAEENEFRLLGLPLHIFVEKIPENYEDDLLIRIHQPVRKIV